MSVRQATSKSLWLGKARRSDAVASPASADGCEPDGGGYGHAYGFVIRRLFGGRSIPVVPVLLNTFYPPT